LLDGVGGLELAEVDEGEELLGGGEEAGAVVLAVEGAVEAFVGDFLFALVGEGEGDGEDLLAGDELFEAAAGDGFFEGDVVDFGGFDGDVEAGGGFGAGLVGGGAAGLGASLAGGVWGRASAARVVPIEIANAVTRRTSGVRGIGVSGC